MNVHAHATKAIADAFSIPPSVCSTPQEAQEGSVSHGTMRPADLIPTFLATLKRLDPLGAESFERAIIADLGGLLENPEYLLEDLFDALENCAPKDCYFGAHEGDGSDYGFWRCTE